MPSKPLSEWDEAYLHQLISSKAEESLTLEFKGASALKPIGTKDMEKVKVEMGKDVSAFANSAGGTIIYGMDEEPKEPHSAKGLSPINPAETSKEWMEHVIHSRIQPRIQGLLIHPIEMAIKHPGSFAFVVEIPESTTAHQASDKKYYKRFNFQSVPMEDYEIRHAMNRAGRPAYKLELSATKITEVGNTKQCEFYAVLENASDVVGHEVSAVLFLPSSFLSLSDETKKHYQGIEYARIPGSISANTSNDSVASRMSPLTPSQFFFRKTALIPHKIDFGLTPFVAIVRVYDQFGLSLEAAFRVFPPEYSTQLLRENHGAKRSASTVELGALPGTGQ